MFGEIAARSGLRARLTAADSYRADRLKPNIVFSKRDSYQRREHLTVCKVAVFRLTLPRVAYLSSVSGLDQIQDHFGVWAFSQRVCGRSAITNPELYRTRDSLAILSKQGKLSKPADL